MGLSLGGIPWTLKPKRFGLGFQLLEIITHPLKCLILACTDRGCCLSSLVVSGPCCLFMRQNCKETALTVALKGEAPSRVGKADLGMSTQQG